MAPCLDDELQRDCQFAKDELRWEAQDRESEGLKRAVPALVSIALARVMRAVHFHDEPRRRSEEVGDEAADDDLAPKPHAELRRPERLPKHPLWLRWRRAHAVRVRFELELLVLAVWC